MDRASARHRIAELAKLPPSPRILRLLQSQISRRPQPTGDIEKTVIRDPALVVALLAMAPRTNAKFGDRLDSTIQSLSGPALDLLVSDALNASDVQQAHFGPLESLRQTAVATAVAAECVARHVSHFNAGDAFLCGLLHNIGKWVLYKLDPARFARCQGGDGIDDPLQLDLETREFGYHHGEAGKWYAETRQLPQSVTDTIWLHHVAPSALSPACFPATSIAIVALAGTFAQRVLGKSNEVPTPDSTRSLLSYLKIDDAKLAEILRESTREFARIEAGEAPEENATPSHRGSDDRYSLATHSDVRALQLRLHRLESLQQGILDCRPEIPFRALVRRCAETIRNGLGVAPGMCLATDAFACELVGATWRTLDDPIADLNADLRDPRGEDVLEPTPILRAVRELGMGKIEAAWRSENAVARRQRDGLIVVPMLHEGQSQGQIAVDTSVSDFGFSDADFADLTFYARTFGAAIAQHHKADLTTLRCEELVRAMRETRHESPSETAPEVPSTSNDTSNSNRLGQFAGGIARTLDGPLGLISSQAQRMLGKAKDIEMHRALDTIVRETRRLNRFRSDLAALIPHPSLHLEPTLINFSIHQFVAAMKSRLDRRGIRVEELYAEGLHRVMLDSRRMEHVYVNLLTLAEDAMDETGGRLTIQTGATPDRKAVILQFTHNGQGISAMPCGDVFEPFNERIASTTGIALAVCRSILDEHGGRISLDRGPQGGDIYTIVFPAAIPDRDASSEVDHPSNATPALQTVLIVDDDEAVREILKQALLMRGFHVITAADGNQAMDTIARKALDVIILDLLMPNRDGLAVLRDLQHIAGAPPVIFMTGNASPQVREEAVTLGADRFLLKPFELRQLLEELDAIVAIRSPRPADHAAK